VGSWGGFEDWDARLLIFPSSRDFQQCGQSLIPDNWVRSINAMNARPACHVRKCRAVKVPKGYGCGVCKTVMHINRHRWRSLFGDLKFEPSNILPFYLKSMGYI
jgi:hypothetical protein